MHPHRDLHTGSQLCQYKGNASSRNCVALLGDHHLVAAQANKGPLLFWAWHKVWVQQQDSSITRMYCTSIRTASPSFPFTRMQQCSVPLQQGRLHALPQRIVARILLLAAARGWYGYGTSPVDACLRHGMPTSRRHRRLPGHRQAHFW